ncbi:MAG: DMT family transporter [Burkholderiaceae bacterium]|nr:DMT family transporter [Burkholderiaceae bacterium]
MPEPRQRPLLGVGLMLLMVAGFAAMDTGVRALAGVFPVLLMLWLRYAFQALVMALWLLLMPGAGFRVAHPRFQVLRGMLLLVTSAMIFFGLQHMPVPELTSINMLAPLLVTLLAAWLLRERVSRLRWLLVGGGLLGALIVIRPGSGVFGLAVLFPLAGAFTYAAFQVLTSRMSALDNPYTTHFWTGLVGMLIVTPLLLWNAPAMLDAARAATQAQWLILTGVATLGTGGHLMLILALGMAPTATLMPFVYTQIPMATAISWLVFGQLPDAIAWVGMAVIMACGASAAWLNLRTRPAAAAPQDAVAAD